MTRLLCLAGTLVCIGCSKGTSSDSSANGQGDQPSQALAGLYRVSKEIEGAQEVGLTPDDFNKLLQKYAAELSIEKDQIKPNNERKFYNMYQEVLEIWKDSVTLWDEKNSMSKLQNDASENGIKIHDPKIV